MEISWKVKGSANITHVWSNVVITNFRERLTLSTLNQAANVLVKWKSVVCHLIIENKICANDWDIAWNLIVNIWELDPCFNLKNMVLVMGIFIFTMVIATLVRQHLYIKSDSWPKAEGLRPWVPVKPAEAFMVCPAINITIYRDVIHHITIIPRGSGPSRLTQWHILSAGWHNGL